MINDEYCYKLIGYYKKLYLEKYGVVPVVNSNSAKWQVNSLLNDMTFEQAKELFDYYFTTGHPTHTLEWFLYNYDKVMVSLHTATADRAAVEKLRAESEERAKRWRERIEQSTSSN